MTQLVDPRQQDLPPDRKPEYDTSLSGLHPALRDLTVSEQELKAAMASAPAGLTHPDETARAFALASAESYAANLKFFGGDDYTGDDKAAKVTFYRSALSQALGSAGRFEEAAAVLCDEAGYVIPAHEAEVALIEHVVAAIAKPDDEACDCARPTATVAVDPNRPERGELALTLNRRQAVGRVWSEKHSAMVTIYRCTECGHTNANTSIPERQVKIERHRADMDQALRAAQRSGMVVTAQNWQPNPAMSDAVLLAGDPVLTPKGED